MRTISSGRTVFYKSIFPAIWFGFLVIFCFIGLSSGMAAKSPLIIVMPLVMAAFGFLLMRMLIFDLADEVLDAGDRLIVRKAGRAIEVQIEEIINVSAALMQNPPRLTLRLRSPSEFGSEIAFMVNRDNQWNPFRATCAIADDLITRVDVARRTLGASPGTPSGGASDRPG